MKGLRFK
jgi:hypothetical protein